MIARCSPPSRQGGTLPTLLPPFTAIRYRSPVAIRHQLLTVRTESGSKATELPPWSVELLSTLEIGKAAPQAAAARPCIENFCIRFDD